MREIRQDRQKGIDTLLSIDLVELASTGQISKAVLLTGDSDFAPAARRARDKGVVVDLFYSPATYVHSELEIPDELLKSVRRDDAHPQTG